MTKFIAFYTDHNCLKPSTKQRFSTILPIYFMMPINVVCSVSFKTKMKTKPQADCCSFVNFMSISDIKSCGLINSPRKTTFICHIAQDHVFQWSLCIFFINPMDILYWHVPSSHGKGVGGITCIFIEAKLLDQIEKCYPHAV